MPLNILRCIARAVVKHAAEMLQQRQSLQETLPDIAEEAVAGWWPERPDYRLVALEALAAAGDKASAWAEETAAMVALPELRQNLAAYLEQVPSTLRRAIERGMKLEWATEDAREFQQLLPLRAPLFQPGARPLAGVDRELVHLLGIGGFGEVWKARNLDRPDDHPVALKFFFCENPKRTLLRELTVLERALRDGPHPGIVALRAKYLKHDPPCLEYDYVEGHDLADQIRAWRSEEFLVRAERSLLLMRELVEVVAFCHSRSTPVIHRDLKPANILLQRTSTGTVVRITDFGIGGLATHLARTKTSLDYQANLTVSLSGAYTRLYASPRQMKGAEPDPLDDVYALGVIWYQLLTGELNRTELPKNLSQTLRKRGVPEEIINLVMRCLASLPERQLASASVLREELMKLSVPALFGRVAKRSTIGFHEELGKRLQPLALPLRLTDTIGMELALIPAGTFTMGSPKTEKHRSDDEGPQHEVEIGQPFYLGVYQVTQEEYEKVMGTNPSAFSTTGSKRQKVEGLDTRRFPVESVSWDAAFNFCKKLSEQPEEKAAGRLYRLPTEAEWEYACRGGARVYSIFHFGDFLSSDQANFDGNHPYGSSKRGQYLKRPTPGGAYKQPNTFGLYDLHGNVWEWCADWYDSNYYRESPRKDPAGAASGISRVLRGGSWSSDGGHCRSAYRFNYTPRYRNDLLGFRVVCVVSTGGKPPPTLAREETKPASASEAAAAILAKYVRPKT